MPRRGKLLRLCPYAGFAGVDAKTMCLKHCAGAGSAVIQVCRGNNHDGVVNVGAPL